MPRVSTQGQRGVAILWNAFAWHPHKPGDLQSNRTPTKQELQTGKEVLLEMMRFFSGTPVIAIGRG